MFVCALVMRLMKIRCDILVKKCAGHLSDGRSSGVKLKLPWSLVVSAGWSLVRGCLYRVDIPSMKKRS